VLKAPHRQSSAPPPPPLPEGAPAATEKALNNKLDKFYSKAEVKKQLPSGSQAPEHIKKMSAAYFERQGFLEQVHKDLRALLRSPYVLPHVFILAQFLVAQLLNQKYGLGLHGTAAEVAAKIEAKRPNLQPTVSQQKAAAFDEEDDNAVPPAFEIVQAEQTEQTERTTVADKVKALQAVQEDKSPVIGRDSESYTAAAQSKLVSERRAEDDTSEPLPAHAEEEKLEPAAEVTGRPAYAKVQPIFSFSPPHAVSNSCL